MQEVCVLVGGHVVRDRDIFQVSIRHAQRSARPAGEVGNIQVLLALKRRHFGRAETYVTGGRDHPDVDFVWALLTHFQRVQVAVDDRVFDQRRLLAGGNLANLLRRRTDGRGRRASGGRQPVA